jgi:hypothetical protein
LLDVADVVWLDVSDDVADVVLLDVCVLEGVVV